MTEPVENTEDTKQKDTIHSKLEEVIATHTAYYRLWLFKFLTKSTADFTKLVIIIFLGFFTILFLSISLAFAVSFWLDSFIWGFLIVGGFCFLVLVIFLLLKKDLIDKQILKKTQKIYFHEINDSDK